jgi:hypothetical protein
MDDVSKDVSNAIKRNWEPWAYMRNWVRTFERLKFVLKWFWPLLHSKFIFGSAQVFQPGMHIMDQHVEQASQDIGFAAHVQVAERIGPN